jgi:ABC-2 type transport system ATP-binding protein
VLTASHLTRRFDTRLAVDDVSFELARGEVFALLGPNGAGKTTTLRMLGGLISPSSGEILIEGTAVRATDSASLRRRIGFLTEAPGLWDRLTVHQNLLVYARLQGVQRPDHAVSESLDLFDLRDRADEFAAELSKGLRQRVALARTLLHRPDVVLLDEPTSGLDPQSARDVRTLVLRLRDERRVVLVSTHNLDEVERLADRVAVLRTRLVAAGTPADLRRRLFGARLRVTLRRVDSVIVDAAYGDGIQSVTVNGHDLAVAVDDVQRRAPEVVRRMVGAGAEVEAVIPEEAPLEDVYLRLIEQEQTT